jgi:hypothetical protein
MNAGSESERDSDEPLSDGDLAVRVWRGEKGRNFASVYGTPSGLRWLAHQLLALARLDQETLPASSLRNGEGIHLHVRTRSGSSHIPDGLVIGRLDAKGSSDTGWFFQ